MLDSTVVALALPSIHHDLGASAEALQWVMNAYLLTIAVLVVTAGRLGDMFGRKRAFLIGIVVFGAGSILAGAAQSPAMLIGGRVLQGVGAAPTLTLSLAIVCNAFPSERTAAGARDLGRDLGDRARGRAAGRRRADRNRLAGDLLDQPADHRRRGRDHVGGGAGVDRPLGRAAGSTSPAWPR